MDCRYSKAVWMEGRRVIEDVVPTKWVDAKTRKVFWPRGIFKQAMEEDQYPVVGQWHEFPLIKVKVSSDSFSCCEDYGFTSSDEMHVPTKASVAEDDSDEEPPRKTKSTPVREKFSVARRSSSKLPSPPSVSCRVLRRSPRTSPLKQSPVVVSSDASAVDFTLFNQAKSSSNKQSRVEECTGSTTGSSSWVVEIQRNQGKIIRELAEIKLLLKDLVATRIVHQPDVGLQQIAALEQLEQLNDALVDPDVFSDMLRSLASVGGSSPRDHVFLVMKRLFSKDLLAKLNRKGKGGKVGLELKDGIWRLLRRSVESVGGNESILKEAVTAVLRNAPARVLQIEIERPQCL